MEHINIIKENTDKPEIKEILRDYEADRRYSYRQYIRDYDLEIFSERLAMADQNLKLSVDIFKRIGVIN